MLDERQRRERNYHADFANQHRDIAKKPVSFDVIEPGRRRPWNAYWTAYDLLIAEAGCFNRRAMVPGCGFGDDAIRLAKLGFEVHAFDLSEDLLKIADQRAKMMNIDNIYFDAMTAENMIYPDDFFDIIFFNDILHHVNIPNTISESLRVIKIGGKIIANELYTHSFLQKIRESRFVSGFLYGKMVRFIYGTNTPYITEDEHKIDQNELAILTQILLPDSLKQKFFLLMGGRVLPSHWLRVAKLDRAALMMLGPAARVFGGRVVLGGTIAK